jgi:hypothetical protein
MACGAAVAMAVTLFIVGPGNIFPIILTIGAGLCVVSSAGGGILGWAAATPWRRHRKDVRQS